MSQPPEPVSVRSSHRVPELRGHQLVDDLLTRCRFPAPGSTAVCGVSGGPDSLALLILSVAHGLHVTAVHVDHGLREESAGEAALVAAAADRFGARFETRPVEVAPGPNLEARARIARHAALGPSALLGHTADDQAETLLINLARGAGPDGVAAMRHERHPILDLRRSETHRLCDELGLVPIVDPSNDDQRFVRNRIRHELLPLLADIAGRDPVPLLTRLSGHTRDLVDGVQRLAESVDVTSTAALREAPEVVARAALRHWLRTDQGHPPSTAVLDRVWEVVLHRARRCELAGGRRVDRTNARLRIVAADLGPHDSFPESPGGSVA